MIHFPVTIQKYLRIVVNTVILLTLATGQVHSTEADGIVRAVLFASPTCAHRTYVKEEVLPPLIARYGSRLQIATVNTTTRSGYELFLSACMKHGLMSLSVPLLIVGKSAVVGSDDIPQKFPGLIEKHIAAGGVDWPVMPGLSTMIDANPAFAQKAEPAVQEPPAAIPGQPVEPSPPASASLPEPPPAAPAAQPAIAETAVPEAPEPAPSRAEVIPPASDTLQAAPSGMIDLTGDEPELGILDRIKRDLYGNGLAIVVLIAMVMTILYSPAVLKKTMIQKHRAIRPHYDWLIPLLALAGLGVAAYLSHVEVNQVEAVCGPVGDCNTVNQSEYAKLFGILPVGALGLAGFLAIISAWALRRWGPGKLAYRAAVGILGMTAFGTLFSIYLTFLEPFVIGATCLWCLSSAVIMTTLFILALKPGCHAWCELKRL